MESNRQLLARHERTRQTVLENQGVFAGAVVEKFDRRIAELKGRVAQESLDGIGGKLRAHEAALDSEDDTLVIASSRVLNKALIEAGATIPSPTIH